MATKTISLLLESRISDFKKKYGSELAPADINYIISKDPSKNQKYLGLLIRSHEVKHNGYE